MPDAAPKAAPDLIHRAETAVVDAAHAVVDTVDSVVHKAAAVQTWTTIAGQLAPVFEQTLGPAVIQAEKSLLVLVAAELPGFEAAFGSLAAAGFKAVLTRIPLSAAVAAVTTAP